MTEKVRLVLSELKVGLQMTYGPRLRGVYLYGSHARGEEDEESDVDVLVVLDELQSYGAEIERTSHAVAGTSLKYGVSISRAFVSEMEWFHKQTSFLANVREEAVSV